MVVTFGNEGRKARNAFSAWHTVSVRVTEAAGAQQVESHHFCHCSACLQPPLESQIAHLAPAPGMGDSSQNHATSQKDCAAGKKWSVLGITSCTMPFH